jgi:hypothetical protein
LMDMKSVESIMIPESPVRAPSIGTGLSETIKSEYAEKETQTENERVEKEVQTLSASISTGTESKPETKDKETQSDAAPPAQTESKAIMTDSFPHSPDHIDSTTTGPTDSTREKIVENTLKSENNILKDNNSTVASNPVVNISVSSTGQSGEKTPITTHNHYYSTTNNNNTVSSAIPQEKAETVTAEAVTAKVEDTLFTTNVLNSILKVFSKDLPNMFSKFIYQINEMTTKSQKNTIKPQRKAEENTMKNTTSNKKPISDYTAFENIKKQCAKQCAYVYTSLKEFLNFTGNRKQVSRLSSEDPSSYPNIRMRYRTLGEDFEGKDFEKPIRSTPSRSFRLSGKRMRKAITKSLSSVRRLALDIEQISYNADHNTRFSKNLKDTEIPLKRSRIRPDFVTG